MDIRKIIKEHIIFEGRLEDAKAFVVKDFKDALIPLSYRNGTKMPEWFNELVESDPSGSQKYLMWELNQIKGGRDKFHPFNVSDVTLTMVIRGVKSFHYLNYKLTPENIKKCVTISQDKAYFKIKANEERLYMFGQTYPIRYLENILKAPKDINSYHDSDLLFYLMGAIEEIPSKADIRKESLRLKDDDYWFMIVPLSERSSCVYGANTKWCTAAKNSSQWSRYQSLYNSLFYFIPKTEVITPAYEDLSKIALHINMEGEYTFYDAADDVVEFSTLKEIIPETYGLNSWQSFESAVLRAKDYHKNKIAGDL